MVLSEEKAVLWGWWAPQAPARPRGRLDEAAEPTCYAKHEWQRATKQSAIGGEAVDRRVLYEQSPW